MAWGSDVAAQMLRRLGIPYIALNPGASYRGFHDSLVNHLGNHAPEMILCLHEEHAVAIAHGYAKATGEPMAVRAAQQRRPDARHDGDLQRLVRPPAHRLLGATGRVDAEMRRPWIDPDPHLQGPGRPDSQLTSNGTTSQARARHWWSRCAAAIS